MTKVPLPNPVAPPLESAETNCPIAEAPPCAFSWNSTSATIILSSNTEPQLVHTASPRAGSTSMSEDPQCLHFFPDMSLKTILILYVYQGKIGQINILTSQNTCKTLFAIRNETL